MFDLNNLGIAGPPFAKWKPVDLLDFMKELGISRLDCSYRHIDAVGAKVLRELLDERDLQAIVVSVSPYLGRVGAPEGGSAIQEMLLRAVEDAKTLGAGCVQFHTAVPEEDDVDAVCRRIAAELSPVLDAAASAGVKLVLENNFDSRLEDQLGRNPAREPETIAALVAATGAEHFRVTFDACNFYVAGIEPFPYAFRVLQPYIENIHIKDATRYSAALYPAKDGDRWHVVKDSIAGSWLAVPVGSGALSWTSMLGELSMSDFAGTLIFEPTATEEALSQWCLDSLAWLRGQAALS